MRQAVDKIILGSGDHRGARVSDIVRHNLGLSIDKRGRHRARDGVHISARMTQ